MTIASERTLRQQAEGYFAIEVQLKDRSGMGDKYLCHALNDREAVRMAGHMVGPGRTVHGFNYYRLELPIAGHPSLPALGVAESVGADGWPALMAAYAASDATFAAHLAAL